MNTPPKKRGRPKSAATIEKDNITKLFENIPPHLKSSKKGLEEQNKLVKMLQNYLKNLHAEFSPTIPAKVIDDLASINDDSMSGYERQILDAYYKAENILADGQLQGAKATSELANKRAQNVWGKNPDLIRRIHSGNLKINGASKILFIEWDKRGDDEEKPSVRTLTNWYKRN